MSCQKRRDEGTMMERDGRTVDGSLSGLLRGDRKDFG